MPAEPLIETVLAALRELGGYFVWRADDGQEYVITSRREFDVRMRAPVDTQLGLLDRSVPTKYSSERWTADDMLERINRDLALYQLQQEEEETLDDNSIQPLPPAKEPFDWPDRPTGMAVSKGKRVRFEPLRGDLPPSLQE